MRPRTVFCALAIWASTTGFSLDDGPSVAERCRDLDEDDFGKCVRIVVNERAAHDKFLRDSKAAEQAAERQALLEAAAAEAQQRREERELRRSELAVARRIAELKQSIAKAKSEQEALAKKPPARIGMSADAVVNTTLWGSPASRHRTTTAAGTREQWVYGESRFLYFEAGKLTAIQD